MNVPITLRNTNILKHDPHYRHLRPLWLLANSGASRELQTPQQKFEVAQGRGARYAAFIELLARKALDVSELLAWDNVSGSATFGPWEVLLRLEKGACSLELLDEQGALVDQLTLVAGWRGRLSWSQQRDNYYVFFCHDSESMDDELGENSILHPLQFYAVERVRLAIEKWLLKQVLGRYPFTVSPIPGELQSAIIAAAGTKVQKAGNGVRFVGLLPPKIEADVEAIVQRSSANEATKRTILTSLGLARLIGSCRVCGHHLPPSSFHGSDNGFKANCGECGSIWMLTTANGKAQSEYRTGKLERPFAEVGCRELAIALNIGCQP